MGNHQTKEAPQKRVSFYLSTHNSYLDDKTNSDCTIKKGNSDHEITDFAPKTFKHLIVDDAKYNRVILSQYLGKFNISSDEASNGHEALLTFNVNDYDIVWMDLRMPIMDGFECTMKLREYGYNGLIVGVTGDVSENNMNYCYEAGMNHVILKPIIFDNLKNLKYIREYWNKPTANQVNQVNQT